VNNASASTSATTTTCHLTGNGAIIKSIEITKHRNIFNVVKAFKGLVDLLENENEAI
jgi:hypothetical protein